MVAKRFVTKLVRFALSTLHVSFHASSTAAATVQYPNVLIQYGVPRTASTFQFKLLHIAMGLLRARDGHVEPILRIFIKDEEDLRRYLDNKSYSYFLFKMHPSKNSKRMIRNQFSSLDKKQRAMMENAWVFSTWPTVATFSRPASQQDLKRIVAQSLYQSRNEAGDKGLADIVDRIKFVQEVAALGKSGRYIAWQYKDILGLSNDQIDTIIEYLRYWEVLRQCCGDQMSDDYRAQLQGRSDYVQHRSRQSSSYPACEMYDIEAVQRALHSSTAMQIFYPYSFDNFPNCSQANHYIATHPENKLFDAIPYFAPVYYP